MAANPVTPPLEAGRALDALIAERLMGYEWRRYYTVTREANVRILCAPDSRYFKTLAVAVGDETRIGPGDCPAYSTDLSAAWLVVEKMTTPGFRFDLAMVHGQWDASWRVDDDLLCEVHDAPTATLAICLAALAAIAYGGTPKGGESA